MAYSIFIAISILIAICFFVIKTIVKRQIHIWLPVYLKNNVFKEKYSENELKHILFCFVDHYEPGTAGAEKETWYGRVNSWMNKYPQIASKFTDSDGYHPRHTWFYPPHYYDKKILKDLVSLCSKGFGEIEMHLHHNRMEPFPEKNDSLKRKIKQCIKDYSKLGIFKTDINGKAETRYAFIHGDWALDNGRFNNPEFCGVNNEITVLLETGCYADFTFPAIRMESQPKTINSIYYAIDDPEKPKSYDTGKYASVGIENQKGLLMIQGPIGLSWAKRKYLIFPTFEDAEISHNNIPTEERIDLWVNTNIHIKNRPEWIIIKVHTHGAPESEHETLLGKPIVDMHKHLNQKYNDGIRYMLHYVTARELYNIVKAAEAGMKGNPGKYRNYIMSPYMYKQN